MIKTKNSSYLLLIFLIPVILALPVQALNLEEAVKLGLEHNSQIKLARLELEKARLDLELAQKALYPEVSLQSSYTYLGEAPMLPNGEYQIIYDPTSFPDPMGVSEVFLIPDFDEGSRGNYSTQLSLQQPLYLGGRIKLGVELARENLKMAELNLVKAENQALLQIIQGYYNVLMSQDRVRIEAEALKLVQEHKRQIQASLEAGTALKTHLLQVEIEEASSRQRLKDAQNNLQLAQKSLANLIGTPVTEVVVPEIKPELNLDYDYLWQLALEKNPDLLQLALSQKLVELNQALTEADKKPSVLFIGNYGWQGDELSLEDGSWNLTLSANWTLFDGGKTELNLKKTAQDLAQVKENQANYSQILGLELEQKLLAVQLALDNIQLQKMNLSKAQENLDLETKRYQVGVGSNVEVLTAQTTLKQARISLMQAEYQYVLNLFALMEKTGQLRDYFGGESKDEK